MSEEQIRKDIDALIAELKAIKAEMALRFGFFKEDAIKGVKTALLIIAALAGLKLALKFAKALIAFFLKHKLCLAAVSALCYLGWRNINVQESGKP